jgi:hypothetical protein
MAACVTTPGPVNAVWELSRGICIVSMVDPEDGGNIFIRNFRVNLLKTGPTVFDSAKARPNTGGISLSAC